MNLQKIFDMQKVLMDRIEKEHPTQKGENRFNKKVLALLVELGECANEWRGFKYWSKRQFPTNQEVHSIDSKGNVYYRNTLLEEYVDGLHFILELGIELMVEYDQVSEWIPKEKDITKKFIEVYGFVNLLNHARDNIAYDLLIVSYLELGNLLGFNHKQIEQAYIDKNKVNHERQNNGY